MPWLARRVVVRGIAGQDRVKEPWGVKRGLDVRRRWPRDDGDKAGVRRCACGHVVLVHGRDVRGDDGGECGRIVGGAQDRSLPRVDGNKAERHYGGWCVQ